MQRFAVGIEFCGIRYKGWQTQEVGIRTVQATLESVLSQIAAHPVHLQGAGRTDAGVHATNMVAHFDSTAIRPIKGWLLGANSSLPKDIALQWIKPVAADFHARFKAQSRRYRYVVYSSPSRPALLHKQVTHAYYPLDVDKMIQAASKFEGTHNFESFRASSCQSKQPVRHVSHCRLIQHGCYLVLDIQADGFLHHMVRNLMGTLYAIGRHELAPADFLSILNKKDRTIAPATASGDGLYFINAYYPERFQELLPDAPLTPLWLNLPN